jgi:disulfide oxidoreductase YuzD
MKNLNGLNNKVKEIEWLPDLEEHNYPAAESYLTLLYSHERVAEMMALFRRAAIVQFKAKDIFRASQLSLLGVSNSHVEKDREKILKGKSLSPLLLLRDQQNGKVVIADGYHRLCAIYEFNEDAVIQCKII